MKTSSFLILVLLLIMSIKTIAQVSIKTEYFGSSSYKDNDGNKVGNSKGSAMVYQGNIKIPISMKFSKDSLTIIWGVNASGAYAALNNKNFSQYLVVSNITNVQLSIFNIRQLNKKWSLITFAGAGIYTNETKISKINSNSILGSGGALFVKKINSKLDLGGGLALTNALGYPMLFPTIYVNYNSDEKYTFRVSMLSGFQGSAGYNFNKTFLLNLIAEMNGQLALLKKDGKDVMFTHQYIVTGLRPEIKINNNISLPITIGVNAIRSVYFNDRTLKSIFNENATNSKFDFSPYVSAEINYKF
ncbi:MULTISPECIES: DUF6268 family outer membrane beta-barrel protein [Flavobacterium]|uniref:DUF6268 family outer membrane beta-barrel protein n=1 Tax=Flavobacterium jumunjinense TaxID=998845 RepID=A0ABV5GPS2_9FLAO|nr:MULTISPECIES: DUF6268 family outer membrane beta-barrel protein [Flavobacterium]